MRKGRDLSLPYNGSIQQRTVIRFGVAPDLGIAYREYPVGNTVIFIAFDDFDEGPFGTHYDAQPMASPGEV